MALTQVEKDERETASPVVLQMALPRTATRKVEDLPWSEGYAYQTKPGQPLEFKLHVYNFATNAVAGRLEVLRQPPSWDTALDTTGFKLASLERGELAGTLRIPNDATVRDGWVVLQADCEQTGRATLAFRVLVSE